MVGVRFIKYLNSKVAVLNLVLQYMYIRIDVSYLFLGYRFASRRYHVFLSVPISPMGAFGICILARVRYSVMHGGTVHRITCGAH